MENFWACIVVSTVVSFIVNLALARHAKDRVLEQLGALAPAAKPPTKKAEKGLALVQANTQASQRPQLKAALLNMGWRAPEVERCITAFGPRVEDEPLPELVREAIGRLAS
jgi:hypothetical protein